MPSNKVPGNRLGDSRCIYWHKWVFTRAVNISRPIWVKFVTGGDQHIMQFSVCDHRCNKGLTHSSHGSTQNYTSACYNKERHSCAPLSCTPAADTYPNFHLLARGWAAERQSHTGKQEKHAHFKAGKRSTRISRQAREACAFRGRQEKLAHFKRQFNN
jgi:hypothetical protein